MLARELRYALALFDGPTFLGFVATDEFHPVLLPTRARLFSNPDSVRIAASWLCDLMEPIRVEPWDLLMHRPLDPEE